MARLDQLKGRLRKGQIYRRNELARWSKSVDRHLEELVEDGTLQKLSQGLYYYPKQTVFGKTPPDENVLVRSFLKDDRFLLTSRNAYNTLGVGTTQLYNERTVYNHKRHGEFEFGNRKFNFRVKPHFPNKVSEEFLLVDLVNNLGTLAENPGEVLRNVSAKVPTMNQSKLRLSVSRYGNEKTKKLFQSMLVPK
jgi:hypothetical protein